MLKVVKSNRENDNITNQKIVGSLALLKLTWESNKDYLDNFVPFIATLIKKNKYKIINIKQIGEDFKEEFGLIVPYHAMVSIINRAREKELVSQDFDGNFVPNIGKVNELDLSFESSRLLSMIDYIINNFMLYANKQYNIEITKENAEKALLIFLKEYSIDLFNEEIPEIKNLNISASAKFLIHKYIIFLYEQRREEFKLIVDVAMGQTLANALFYDELQDYKGRLLNSKYFFDTNFVLRLLGFEGEERAQEYNELIGILLEEKADLYVFDHTYYEIMGILKDCEKWVEHKEYDPDKASKTLEFFVQAGLDRMEIARIILSLEEILKNYGIKIYPPINYNEDTAFQIDEDALYDEIIKVYERNSFAQNMEKLKYTIMKDIKSISTVYRLRAGMTANSISEAKYLFITTNKSLAHANKIFHKYNLGREDIILPCISDVILGTMVWLYIPARAYNLNEKKVIANCYAALKPSSELIKKFCSAIFELKEKNQVSEDEFYLLRTYSVARVMLTEKTLGDPNAFTNKTAKEILADIKETIRHEYDEKLELEKEHHRYILEQLQLAERDKAAAYDEISRIENNINALADKKAEKISKSIFVILLIFTVASFTIPSVQTELFNNNFRRLFIGLGIIISIFSFVFGINLKGIRDSIKNFIKKSEIRRLSKIKG